MTKSAEAKDTPDAEYKRFLETAKQVEAGEDAEAFDKAFVKVVKPIKPTQPAKP